MKYIIWLTIILLIIFRYFLIKPKFVNGDKVRITSTIYSDPINYEKSQYIKLSSLKIYLPLFPEINYGDKIIVEGVVKNGTLENSKIINVGEGSFLSNYRQSIIKFYKSTLPQPEGGLLSGIIIGSKGALSNDFYNDTKKLGIAHIVVASGTNITFVVSFLFSLFSKYLERRKVIYFCILGIILYLFVSGFEAPLIRASIMVLTLFLVQNSGRVVNTLRILFLTGGLMLIINPFWIIDLGFILSFVSTFSLIVFSKRIEKFFNKWPSFLKESLSTTISAQIGVGPILFVTFGYFNIFSVLVNALILWTIPFIMVLGTLGAVFKLKIFLYICYPFLWWITHTVKLFLF